MLTLKSRNQGQCPCWLVVLPDFVVCHAGDDKAKSNRRNGVNLLERDFFMAVRESHRHGDRMKGNCLQKGKNSGNGLVYLEEIEDES